MHAVASDCMSEATWDRHRGEHSRSLEGQLGRFERALEMPSHEPTGKLDVSGIKA